MKNKSRIIKSLFATLLALSCVFGLASCGKSSDDTGSKEKNITVVVREQGSGTREAFDKVVTDGEHFLEDSTKRANEGSDPIEVTEYKKQATLPTGGKIVVRGSTSR